MHWYFMNSSN